jgi:hypothetical protein
MENDPVKAKVVDLGFRWDGAAQHHVPKLVVEFEPVPANSPCDHKGWRDRDSVAALLSSGFVADATHLSEEGAALVGQEMAKLADIAEEDQRVWLCDEVPADDAGCLKLWNSMPDAAQREVSLSGLMHVVRFLRAQHGTS